MKLTKHTLFTSTKEGSLLFISEISVDDSLRFSQAYFPGKQGVLSKHFKVLYHYKV